MFAQNEEHVKEIEEWLLTQPHLPSVTKFQIVCFLHSCFYNLELTKVTIDNFFSIRSTSPDIFGYHGEDEIKRIGTISTAVLLPQKSPENTFIIFLKLLNPSPDLYSYVEQANFFDKVLYLTLEQNGSFEGVTCVFDWSGFSFRHLPKFYLYAMKKFIFYMQDSIPIRLKKIHIFNINFVFKRLLSLTRPFLKKEFFDLLYFHQDLKEVCEYIPQELLPEDYGGKAPSVAILTNEMICSINHNSKVFQHLDSQKVDKNKKPKTNWAYKMFGF